MIVVQKYPPRKSGPAFSRGGVTVIIDRAKWDRGPHHDGYERMLLNKGGGMCCLGFVCLAIGYKEKDIRGIGMPMDLDRPPPLLCSQGIYKKNGDTRVVDGQEVSDAVKANDGGKWKDAVREAKITKALAPLGIHVRFVGSGRWTPPKTS